MKTIILNKTKVKEVILSKEGDNYVVQAVYLFEEDNGKEYGSSKRAIFKDLTTAQQDKLKAIFDLLEIKTKQIEKL